VKQQYKEYIKLNKNTLLGFAASIIISAIVAQLFSGQVGEMVYTIIRWILQYYFLTIGYDTYIASLVSQSTSTVIYMVVVNLSVKLMRLYKNGP